MIPRVGSRRRCPSAGCHWRRGLLFWPLDTVRFITAPNSNKSRYSAQSTLAHTHIAADLQGTRGHTGLRCRVMGRGGGPEMQEPGTDSPPPPATNRRRSGRDKLRAALPSRGNPVASQPAHICMYYTCSVHYNRCSLEASIDFCSCSNRALAPPRLAAGEMRAREKTIHQPVLLTTAANVNSPPLSVHSAAL